MRIPAFYLTAAIVLCLASGCFGDVPNPRYNDQVVRAGYQVIPEARQIEELYEEVDHFVTSNGPWNSVAYFGGRYELTMQVPVDARWREGATVEVTGEMVFYLHEVTSIELLEGDRVAGSYGAQFTLTPDEWKQVYEAGGDFSVVGIHLKSDPPIEHWQAHVDAWRRDVRQVELP